MARQHVRYIWSSFWFTHLGEYLPDAPEWEPYTYAKWWKLAQTMNDEKIRAFVRTMHERGIGTYAYFNVTEYGGAGGKTGDTAEAAQDPPRTVCRCPGQRCRGQRHPDVGRRHGHEPWQPVFAVAAAWRTKSAATSSRLPEIDGFVIDRLDWASVFDYAHDDGLSMIGERPVENLAVPVSEAVHRVAELVARRGQTRVRQPVLSRRGAPRRGWRLPRKRLSPGPGLPDAAASRVSLAPSQTVLRGPAGVRGPTQTAAPMGPVPADDRASVSDLAAGAGPACRRLPGTVRAALRHAARQGTGAVAALRGGDRGRTTRTCSSIQSGHYIVPITSRTRFISRPGAGTEPVIVTLRVPAAEQFTWAHAISADGASLLVHVSLHRTEKSISRSTSTVRRPCWWWALIRSRR